MDNLRFDWSTGEKEDLSSEELVHKLQNDPVLSSLRQEAFADLAELPIGRAIGTVITVLLKGLVHHEQRLGRALTIAEERALIASFAITAFGA